MKTVIVVWGFVRWVSLLIFKVRGGLMWQCANVPMWAGYFFLYCAGETPYLALKTLLK